MGPHYYVRRDYYYSRRSCPGVRKKSPLALKPRLTFHTRPFAVVYESASLPEISGWMSGLLVLLLCPPFARGILGSDVVFGFGQGRPAGRQTNREQRTLSDPGCAQEATAAISDGETRPNRVLIRQYGAGGTRKPSGLRLSTKRLFRLLTYTLKSSSCVALLDVVEKSSIGRMRPPRPAVRAVTDGVRPTNTAWNRGWSCGLVTTSDSKQCHTFKRDFPIVTSRTSKTVWC